MGASWFSIYDMPVTPEVARQDGQRLVLERLQELVVEDRQVRALNPGGLEDVDHPLRRQALVDQVADRLLEFALGPPIRNRLEDLLAGPLVEDQLVRVGTALVEMLDEEVCVADAQLGLEECVARLLVLAKRPVDERVAVFELHAREPPPVAVVDPLG